MINNCTKILCYLFTVLIFINQALATENAIKEYGIIIFPEDKCIKVAEKLNKDIRSELPDIDNSHNHPHVTLYHGAYRKEDLDEIYNKIRQLNFKPLALNFTKIYSTSDRWIDWGVEKSEYLGNLHRKVVEIANPYHKRPLERSADIYRNIAQDKRTQIDKYGVSGVLELYNPHMTLFYQYPANPELQKVAENISAHPKENMLCKADKIVIGELGYNGNIIKINYSIYIPS